MLMSSLGDFMSPEDMGSLAQNDVGRVSVIFLSFDLNIQFTFRLNEYDCELKTCLYSTFMQKSEYPLQK